MQNSFEEDVKMVLVQIEALPRAMGQRAYKQALFDRAFPKIHELVRTRQKTKREIVGNLNGTPMEMSYSTFLDKYKTAKKTMPRPPKKEPGIAKKKVTKKEPANSPEQGAMTAPVAASVTDPAKKL